MLFWVVMNDMVDFFFLVGVVVIVVVGNRSVGGIVVVIRLVKLVLSVLCCDVEFEGWLCVVVFVLLVFCVFDIEKFYED